MSYPYLSDVVRDATGYNLPLPLATFGLFVALGALAAAACFRAELQRLYPVSYTHLTLPTNREV